MTIWEQRKQWQFLRKSVQSGQVSHAYLFAGPRGLGKKEVALEFARLLNCQARDFEQRPCGHCLSCQEIAKKTHPDLFLIDGLGEAEEAEINLIRDVGRWLSLKPGLGKFRVLIIDQFQGLSLPAQSALLKTLEEPRGEAVLILISDYPELLTSTILSRLQGIRFYPWPRPEMIDLLISRGAVASLAERIYRLSFGRPTRALQLLEPEQLKKAEEKIERLAARLGHDLPGWFREIETLVKENDDLNTDLALWLDTLRLIFLVKLGAIQKESLAATERKLLSSAAEIPLFRIKDFLFSLAETNYLLSRTNTNPRLAIENAVLKLF
ncbi:MAG: hypothetical protein HY577_00110 [Candidatus Nealsonbacteria bacterium]|nr:hypothetical protein [Candidatus Nealsonbacteria bacterium]